jgi:WD40 repeat protein
VKRWMAHENTIRCLAFTPDGGSLMSGSQDMTVKAWDISSLTMALTVEDGTKEEIQKFVGHRVCWI